MVAQTQKLITMDIVESFKIWDELGNTIDSHTDENNNYVIEFINKSGKVVGNIITYPGQGISWNYPQELMDRKKVIDEIANMSLKELEEYSY
jgi:hypothetical protein